MIREVQIVSSGYAPEFGQTTGMVYNAVTPSGTNRLTRRRRLPVPHRRSARRSRSSSTPAADRGEPAGQLAEHFHGARSAARSSKNKLFFYGGFEQHVPGPGPRESPSIRRSSQARRRRAAAGQHRRHTARSCSSSARSTGRSTRTHRAVVPRQHVRERQPVQPERRRQQRRSNARHDFSDGMYVDGQRRSSRRSARATLNELRVQYAQRHFARGTAHDPSVTRRLGQRQRRHGERRQQRTSTSAATPATARTSCSASRRSSTTSRCMRGNAQLQDRLRRPVDRRPPRSPAAGDLHVPDPSGLHRRQVRREPARATRRSRRRSANPIFDMNNAMFSAFVQDDWKLTPTSSCSTASATTTTCIPSGIEGAPYNSTLQPRQEQPRAARGFRVDARRRTPRRSPRQHRHHVRPAAARDHRERLRELGTARSRTTACLVERRRARTRRLPEHAGRTSRRASSGVEHRAGHGAGLRDRRAPGRTTSRSSAQLGTNYSISVGVRYTRGYDLPVINDVNLAGVTPVRFLEDGRGVYSTAVNASTRVDPRYNRVRLVSRSASPGTRR